MHVILKYKLLNVKKLWLSLVTEAQWFPSRLEWCQTWYFLFQWYIYLLIWTYKVTYTTRVKKRGGDIYMCQKSKNKKSKKPEDTERSKYRKIWILGKFMGKKSRIFMVRERKEGIAYSRKTRPQRSLALWEEKACLGEME